MKITGTDGSDLWVVRMQKQYVTTYIVAADSGKSAIAKVDAGTVPNSDVEYGEARYTAERYTRAGDDLT